MKNMILNIGFRISILYDIIITYRLYSILRSRFFILCTICMIINFGCNVSEKPQDVNAAQFKKINDTWVMGIKGLWVEDSAKKSDHAKLTKEQKEQIDKLRSIGYLAGYKTKPQQSGITKYDKMRAFNGLNLCVSGHKPEAILMDMNGSVLHRWSYSYDQIKNANPDKYYLTGYWRRAYLYENGDLLAIYEGLGLIKIDKFSRLQWYYKGMAHHDIYVTKNGEIYVLTREAKMIPRLNKEKPILEDFICKLSPDGKEIEKVSLIECFNNSKFSKIPLNNYKIGGDIFHTNTLELIDSSFKNQPPAFRQGNFLISIRNLHLIATVDIEKKSIVAVIQGMWRTQHEPQLLRNGNIILFDNTGYNSYSRVMEINPFLKKVEWKYVGNPPESFHSIFCGTVQRLQNRNTLITETCSGKAFEVTREDKRIVWEYINPNRAGKNNELIAALLHVTRLNPDFPTNWIPDNMQAVRK